MAWAAAIPAAAGIIGDIMGSNSQAQTNAMNMAMMMQNEQWQTQMSNTQEQRRVADLKAAGINPLMAVTGGGGLGAASMPGFQQPQLGAPGASFTGLGAQMSNAMSLGTQAAQIDLLHEQARKTGAEAGTAEFESSPGYLMWRSQMMEQQYGISNAEARQATILVGTMTSQRDQAAADAKFADFRQQFEKLSVQAQKATLETMIQAQNAQNKAIASGAINENSVQSSTLGKGITWGNAILKPVGTAAGIASQLTPAGRTFNTINKIFTPAGRSTGGFFPSVPTLQPANQ